MAAGAAQFVITGIKAMLDAMFKTEAEPEDVKVALFSTDVSIADATVAGDLTLHTTNGLAAITLTKATFTAATAANPSVLVYNSGTGLSWTATAGPNTVYGWAIIGVTSGILYAARNWGLKTVQDEEIVSIEPAELKLAIPA